MALLLTYDEAISFLRHKLGVDVNSYMKLSRDDSRRLALLNEIAVAFHRNIPFQSLTNMAVQPELRRLPTPDEIKQEMLAGRGGLCTSLNYFCQQLLSALGFNSSLAAGTVGADPHINHAVVVVRDVATDGDVYVVEVGLGYATFRAVALDFSLSSPVYRDSFQPYRYVRLSENPNSDNSNGQLLVGMSAVATTSHNPSFARLHSLRSNTAAAAAAVTSDTAVAQDDDEGSGELMWKQCYWFTLATVEYSYIAQLVNETIYRNMNARLSRTIRVTLWPGDGRAVILRDRTLFREVSVDHSNTSSSSSSSGVLEAVDLETDDELVRTVLSEFPVFDEPMVRQAFDVWKSLPPYLYVQSYP